MAFVQSASMKKPQFRVFAVLLSAFLPFFFLGCSKPADKVDVSAQTTALKSADRDARVNACIELAKAGPKAAPAVSALIPVLKDPDAEVRRLAAYALMEIGEAAKAAAPTVKEMLNDPDQLAVRQAINTLRAIDPTAKDLPGVPNVSQGPKP